MPFRTIHRLTQISQIRAPKSALIGAICGCILGCHYDSLVTFKIEGPKSGAMWNAECGMRNAASRPATQPVRKPDFLDWLLTEAMQW